MALLVGILVGFILAVPPGAIVLVGLRLALARGLRHAAPYAVGSMLADIGFAAAALFAADALRGTLGWLSDGAPALLVVLRVAVVTVLIGGGIHMIARRTPIALSPEAGMVDHRRLAHTPFLLGLLLNLSNGFVSPTFMAALAVVVAQAAAFGILGGTLAGHVRYAVGFGVGGCLYMLLLMRAAVALSARMHDRRILIAQRSLGTAFTAIGFVLGIGLVEALVA